MKKHAQIVAALLEVHCPHCGDPQPAPDNGSHAWTPLEVSMNQTERTCVACDEPFVLSAQSKVTVSS